MAQIEIHSRSYNLERQIKLSFFSYFHKAQMSFEVFFVSIDRHIAIVIIRRNAETACSYYVFCILRNKWRRVISATIWQLNYFSSFECFQVNTRNPWRVISIGKKPAAVHFSVSLR
ncbi:hypothetical protein D3C80_1713430 [compost metagenome]